MDTKKLAIAVTTASLFAETARPLELEAACQANHNQPHTHSELQNEGRAPAKFPSVISRAQRQRDLFHLRIGRLPYGFPLIAVPEFGWTPDSQMMYGHCATLQELLDVLTPKLTAEKLAAVRRRYSGASVETVQLRIFDRRELRRMGLTFRPPEETAGRLPDIGRPSAIAE